MNAEDVGAIKTWLRDATVVFDKVTNTQAELGRIRQEAGLLEAKAVQLRAEKADLEKWLQDAKDSNKTLMPPCPIPAKEFQGLWNSTTSYFRPFVEKLAGLWGVTIEQ